jgi:two-component sensor histidine kinase
MLKYRIFGFLTFLFFQLYLQAKDSSFKVDSLLRELDKAILLQDQQKINLLLAKEITTGYQSLQYAKQSLKLASELKDKKQMGFSYIELGNDYIQMNDCSGATESLFQAIHLFNEIDDERDKGITFVLLGDLYQSYKKYTDAIQFYKNAIDIQSRLNDYEQLGNAFNNIGEIYRVKSVMDSALFYFKEATRNFKIVKYLKGIAYAEGNIALIDLRLGRDRSAIRKLQELNTFFKQLKEWDPISYNNNEIAKSKCDKGDYHSALQFAEQAYDIASMAKSKERLRDASMTLHTIYRKKQDYEHSIDYLNTYHSFNDSIINEKNIQQLNDLQKSFEAAKKEKQINTIKAISERNFNGFLALCVVALLVGVLSFYFLLLNKKLKKVNKKLQEQSLQLNMQKALIEVNLKEKETLLKEIHHRVKNNLQIISSLLNLQSNTLINEEFLEIFKKGQSRIQSIALIHQRLYQNDEITVINIKEYTEQLILKLIDCLSKENLEIDSDVVSENILLDIDTAVPLGLIINELITNSIKYAFKDNSRNSIRIEITEQEKHYYKLHYADTGEGLPNEFNLECSVTLGSKLLSILTRQLGGKIRYYNEDGANFIITFYDVVKIKEAS